MSMDEIRPLCDISDKELNASIEKLRVQGMSAAQIAETLEGKEASYRALTEDEIYAAYKRSEAAGIDPLKRRNTWSVYAVATSLTTKRMPRLSRNNSEAKNEPKANPRSTRSQHAHEGEGPSKADLAKLYPDLFGPKAKKKKPAAKAKKKTK